MPHLEITLPITNQPTITDSKPGVDCLTLWCQTVPQEPPIYLFIHHHMSHWQYRISATRPLISINSPLRNCPPRCPKVCLKLSPNDWNPAIIVVNSWLEQIRFEEGKEGETGLFSFNFTTHWLWIWSEVYSMTNEGKLQKISPDILKTSSVCSHFWNRINPLKHCATFQPRVCDIRPQAKKKKDTWVGVVGKQSVAVLCAAVWSAVCLVYNCHPGVS